MASALFKKGLKSPKFVNLLAGVAISTVSMAFGAATTRHNLDDKLETYAMNVEKYEEIYAQCVPEIESLLSENGNLWTLIEEYEMSHMENYSRELESAYLRSPQARDDFDYLIETMPVLKKNPYLTPTQAEKDRLFNKYGHDAERSVDGFRFFYEQRILDDSAALITQKYVNSPEALKEFKELIHETINQTGKTDYKLRDIQVADLFKRYGSKVKLEGSGFRFVNEEDIRSEAEALLVLNKRYDDLLPHFERFRYPFEPHMGTNVKELTNMTAYLTATLNANWCIPNHDPRSNLTGAQMYFYSQMGDAWIECEARAENKKS